MKLNGNFYTKKELMQKLDCTKQQFDTLKEKSYVEGRKIGQTLIFSDDDYLELSKAKTLIRSYTS